MCTVVLNGYHPKNAIIFTEHVSSQQTFLQRNEKNLNPSTCILANTFQPSNIYYTLILNTALA
jgi:hypothetical protein